MKTAVRLLVACLLPVASGIAAEPLGRLFFTSEQRALFDRQRRDGATARAPAVIRLDGLVVRSGKNMSTWINGRAYDDADFPQAAGLRVGEAVDPVTRQKTDLLHDGSIARQNAR